MQSWSIASMAFGNNSIVRPDFFSSHVIYLSITIVYYESCTSRVWTLKRSCLKCNNVIVFCRYIHVHVYASMKFIHNLMVTSTLSAQFNHTFLMKCLYDLLVIAKQMSFVWAENGCLGIHICTVQAFVLL